MTVTKNFNNLDTDNTLGGNSPSDYRVSSQKAIKEYVDNNSVDTAQLSYYGTCATAAATQAKVVECPEFMELKEGVSIRVKFTNTQSYNGQATLNVNSTGAKGIVSSGTTKAVRYCWLAGEVVSFTYNGTNWVMEDAGIATTSYYGYTRLYTGATSSNTATALTPNSLNALVQNMIEPYPVYSATATYAVGDRVRYNYNAWECNTAIETAEAWTAAHWTMLDPIQTQIDNIRKLVEFKKPTTSSPSWYNLYSDGYVEQGGEITVGNTTIGQVTFSKEFENDKYMPILTCITYTAGNIDGLCHITELTTTGMKIFDASGRTYRWECKGYINNV